MEIDGATAIVTGASRGLGALLARRLGEAGARVALAARSKDDLEKIRQELEHAGVESVAVPTDVTDATDRQRLIDETEAALGPVDLLVNNAGIESVGAFDDLDPADIESIIEVNLTSALLLTAVVLPGMLERGRGHVVNMASAAGKNGVPFQVPYSASKFGLVGATSALRSEYHDAPVGFSAICPGFVTDEGMYARFEDGGIRAPRLVGTTTPEKVVRATLDAIRRDRAEVIVNDVPLRPAVVLSEIAPGLRAQAAKLTGLTAMGRRAADRSPQD